MGQYFKAAVKTQSGKQFTIARSGFNKMMEWGYLFSSDMMCILFELEKLTQAGNTVKYYHAGDYSEKIDAYDWDVGSISITKDGEALDGDEQLYKEAKERTLRLYLYNHTKKEMVSLQDYYNNGFNCESLEDDKDWAIHPLAFLCCTEQGLGGGDYRGLFRGKKLEDGGDWFGDDISVSSEVKVGFTDITNTLFTSDSVKEYQSIVESLATPYVLDKSVFGQF